MKNKINKLVSLLMVFFMTFSLFAPLANARIEDGEKGTIAISGVSEEVDITAYRIATVNFKADTQETTTPVYEWVDGLDAWMEENFPDYADADNFEDGAIVGTEKEDGTKYPTADEVYDAMAAAIRAGDKFTLTSAKTTGKINADATIEDVDMGVYLILIENGLKVYKPAAVNVVPEWKNDGWVMTTPAAKVNMKSTDVGIRKTVVSVTDDENIDTVRIGDIVEYSLEVDVPHYPVNSKNKTFIVSDKITDKLVIDFDSITVYDENYDVISEEAYTVDTAAPTLNTDGTTTVDFQIVFDYDKLRNDETSKADKLISISYTAFVTKDVKIGPEGNNNTGYLEYSTNPYSLTDEVKMTSDDVNVYSYGIILNKVGKNNVGLPGALFTLSDETSGETDRNDFGFVKIGDGKYRLALTDEEEGVEVVTEITGDSENGILYVEGLRAGTYYFKETKAPAGGYNRLKKDIEITIYDEENDKRDGIVEVVKTNEDGTTEYASSDNGRLGYAEVTVENKNGFQLPETGGIGTIIFTVVGIVLMGVGVIFFKRFSRKENN